jgi:two-component system, cell cycle response regulator
MMLLSVLAAWDLMRTGQPGRPALSEQQARASLRECRGLHFKPEAVDAFLRSQAERPVEAARPA